MVKKTTYGSVKRLGTRYGRTVKFKLGKIEAEQRKKHKCPYCNYAKVRRKSLGIWHCSKCGATFTNKAYTVGKLGPLVKPVEKEELPPMAAEKAKTEEAASDNLEENNE
jgi:large subunit ribosomal protein L37Ae